MRQAEAEAEAEAEQLHVTAAYRLLDERLADVRARLADTLRTGAAGPGEVYAREAAAGHLAGRVRQLEGAEEGLVFGRIDAVDGTVLHLGRIGLRTDEHETPLVVDWRAEAARPFYEATSLRPLGLRRRRHLRVESRRVCAVSDELLDGSPPACGDVVGDGPLTQVLEAGRTGRMRAAVATLQTEQDAIVRSAHRGVTVVQGGPGTGKTVVALHRAAYVLYAFPRVAEQGVLILGPNTRFLDYISQVLPSLGENGAVLATCAGLAPVTPSGAEPAATARLKGRAELADALAALVRSRQVAHHRFAVQVGRDLIRLPGEDVARAGKAATTSGLAHNPARALFKRYLADLVVDALELAVITTLEAIDTEALESTGLDLDQAVEADLRALGLDGAPTAAPEAEFDADAVRGALLDDPRFDHAVETLWPRLTPDTVVHAVLADAEAMALHLPSLTDGERTRLLRAPDAGWTDADAVLLDEATALVEGLPERTFGHVVVDEAQELTAMQWRMVLRRCPSRSMTLVGDFAQAGPTATARSWAEALEPHLSTRYALHTLTVSYRSTHEILSATRDLLARIAPDQAPTPALRHGPIPRELTTHRDAVVTVLAPELRAQATAHPGDLLAVICADSRAAELAAAGIDRWARVVPVSQVRGLEFDAVVLIDPPEIVAARPCGERDLYVALTRATKRLCTVTLRSA
ncbi:HelD family protein [Rhizohabitans arisaemae]|uniref:HelD family protein n=1 Tax=Rhizohabitans arisaemae TaxID=2720610 RepID=UPI0024B1F37B|nr:AAA family ATPase [Rhizohabitans arisaemae]